MKKTVAAIMVTAAFTPALAMAETGDIVVRIRAAYVSPDEESKLGETTTSNIGAMVFGASNAGKLTVDSNTIPEIDFSYYLTKNIAAELILATGTRHDVKVSGSTGAISSQALGSVNLLPPTLTLQWHFMPDQMFDPYVGAGINYTRFMDKKLNTSTGLLAPLPIRVDSSSWGAALQAGFDVNLKDGWLINTDVKKAWISTDVEANVGGVWTKIDSLDIDPWIIGVGVGRKF